MTEGVKECCTDLDNLDQQELSDDLVVRTCRVCNCRHFELTVDAAQLGVDGVTL